MIFFRQRTAMLFNGQKVREGDIVEFTNSDGRRCRGHIQRDISNPKRLFFWNNSFGISDYRNAYRIDI